MSQQITKVVADKYEIWVKQKTYDVSEIEAEIVRLQTELNEPEPTKEELIECGKATHPYYMQQQVNSQTIEQLQTKIIELTGTTEQEIITRIKNG